MRALRVQCSPKAGASAVPNGERRVRSALGARQRTLASRASEQGAHEHWGSTSVPPGRQRRASRQGSLARSVAASSRGSRGARPCGAHNQGPSSCGAQSRWIRVSRRPGLQDTQAVQLGPACTCARSSGGPGALRRCCAAASSQGSALLLPWPQCAAAAAPPQAAGRRCRCAPRRRPPRAPSCPTSGTSSRSRRLTRGTPRAPRRRCSVRAALAVGGHQLTSPLCALASSLQLSAGRHTRRGSSQEQQRGICGGASPGRKEGTSSLCGGKRCCAPGADTCRHGQLPRAPQELQHAPAEAALQGAALRHCAHGACSAGRPASRRLPPACRSPPLASMVLRARG